MPTWKLNIFVSVVSKRMVDEDRTAEDILNEYIKLTDTEKQEIIQTVSQI